jgi:hypothetical protein
MEPPPAAGSVYGNIIRLKNDGHFEFGEGRAFLIMKTGWFWDRWRGGLVNQSEKLHSIYLLASQKRIERRYHHSSAWIAILL